MLNQLPKSFFDWLIDLRRKFHQFPELQYQEEKTAARICEVLKELRVPFQPNVGKTGIVARLSAAKAGRTIAFRADMDALPLDEANNVPYKSKHPGVMHACGHDAHITIALGIIRWLVENDWIQNGAGEILFIFQPAEEGGAGAKAMLDSGIFDAESVSAVFAGHVYPAIPVGHIGIAPKISNSAVNTLSVRLKGKGGHGAYPHQCKDPIVAGSYLVSQLQTLISRNLPPLESAVITIGAFHAGTAPNIIPEEALLKGTLRTFMPEIREQMAKRIEDVVKGTEISFGVSAVLENIEGYPVLMNDPELVKHMNACAEEVLGAGCIHPQPPSMGAEDFAYFCEQWGGIMVDLGCHDPQKGFQYGLHSPHFDIDERVLDVGTRLFGHALIRYLETQ